MFKRLLPICVLIYSRVFAADPYPVEYLGIEKGLSNNAVTCIYQDHNGFMWFGTYDGLNRYDGYSFKVYRNKFNDSNSLANNRVTSLSEDRQNNLWIGTSEGLRLYNGLSSNLLSAYFVPFNEKSIQKITAPISNLQTDGAGDMFIGTETSGLLFCPAEKTTAVSIPAEINGQLNAHYWVQSIKINNGRVWVFIRDQGLFEFSLSTRQLTRINNELRFANAMERDAGNNLWIGTNDGLYKYDISNNKLIKSFVESSGQLSAGKVVAFCFDREKNLWIATDGGGIDILNTQTNKITYLLHGHDRYSLTSESIYAVYEDKESRKWIGTLRGGINVIDPMKNRFKTIAQDPERANSLINNFVLSFYEDPSKNLWIGTDGGGLSIWDRRKNSFTNFKYQQEQRGSLSNNFVTCIKRDYLGETWIATYGGGINRFVEKSNSFVQYRCVDSITGIENKNAWLLFEDSEHNLWASTFAKGKLYKLNRTTDKFEVFDDHLEDILSMSEDRQGNLWAGNWRQLLLLDKKTKKHVTYDIGKPVRAIYEDASGHFWIGTEGDGLVEFDRVKGRLNHFTTANGLCNNSVLNILEHDGKLWISTFNGISRFDLATKTFKNFYQDDGLQSNQFNYNAALELKSGEFLFGGIKGFNIFYPDSIKPFNFPPPVVLSALKINNVPIDQAASYVAKAKLDKIETLKIPYDQAVISFDFAALEYSAPNKISYAYFLEGWDKDWNYTGNLRTANYSHVGEGSYTLRIKSTDAEGNWNPREFMMSLVVLPPFYRTWWAYLIYILAAAAMIYFYLRYKSRQARLEYEIRIAHLNAEKEREIHEKKLSFFTDISHEFRSPLTLIINPITDLLKRKYKEDRIEHDLNIVYRNSRRLLSLVDQLLLFRKAETEGDKLRVTKLNFAEICKEVYLCFVQQAESKNVTYSFDCSKEDIEVFADREKIEIALYNLLSNALKFTSSGGHVSFVVKEFENEVAISIADSGCGIPEDIGQKLFEKFYQVKGRGTPSSSGFGIGLYLVKHFVERHHGDIFYESEVGKGTTFLMKLNKGVNHFDSNVVFESFSSESVFLEAPLVEENIKKEKSKLDELVLDNPALLVVDDNEQIRRYIAEIFENRFTIYEADNGDEALNLAKQYLPDIIISDVVMPKRSGIDFCDNIKQDPDLRHIPLILLTGSASQQTKLRGVEFGADDYITKPFDKELLIARVANLLKSRNNLQRYFYNEITLQHNPLKISAEYKEFLEKCITIVEEHLEEDQFNIKKLAIEIGMSHSNLYKKVKSISGQSVSSFIRFIRLRRAAELFINTQQNVNETAFQVGIMDVKYFREQFFKLFGMNPSDYIKKYRKTFGKSYTLDERVLNDESKMNN
jgi:signal transduction histidine kinase/ligand-binding sensor domain-containing protein/DNA-binding response OmpR family regulator